VVELDIALADQPAVVIGIAYGMGKRCYAVGTPEKTETLYCVFTRIFEDL